MNAIDFRNVLIVDDSSSIRYQVSQVLSQAGFRVLEAVDGLDGAEKIRALAELALVICDVNMPKLNGLEMLESIKDELQARGLPVLMLTTEGQPEAIARAKKSGAKAWIIKPFKEHVLVGAVQKLTQYRP